MAEMCRLLNMFYAEFSHEIPSGMDFTSLAQWGQNHFEVAVKFLLFITYWFIGHDIDLYFYPKLYSNCTLIVNT